MKILLVDGNNLAYRNHFANQGLANSTGQATGMTFGFINSILSIQRELKAEIVTVVWDSRNSAAQRKAVYALYKANREAQGPDFYEQKEMLMDLLQALGVRQVIKDESECDDIIGYLALRHFINDEVYILSNDKDFLQLIDGHRIHVISPKDGLVTLTDGKVELKESGKSIWLRPDQIVSFKAMKGDTSDNIPGIVGFGMQAAIDYFRANDSVDAILDCTANIGTLSSRARNALIECRGMMPIFKQLVTIQPDWGQVELPDRPNVHKAKVSGYFDMLEFKQFQMMGDKIYIIGGVDNASA